MQGVYHFAIHHVLPIFSVAKFEHSYTIYKQFSTNGWAQSLLLSLLSHMVLCWARYLGLQIFLPLVTVNQRYFDWHMS